MIQKAYRGPEKVTRTSLNSSARVLNFRWIFRREAKDFQHRKHTTVCDLPLRKVRPEGGGHGIMGVWLAWDVEAKG
jgi:hypothetical protein